MIDIDVIGQLIPNIWTVIVQLCSTFVLFLVIKKYLWKSVTKFLNARADKMQEELSASEQSAKEAQKDREEAQGQLQKAAKTSEQILESAHKEAVSQKEELLAGANRQASAITQKAREQAEAERSRMQSSMQKEMVEVAMDAAGKLIGEKSSEEMDRKAVDAYVKEASRNGK